MSRWLPAIALGAAFGVAGLVAVLTLRSDVVPSDPLRVEALAAELRCPDCQGLSVADSPTAAAREIRRQIGELVAAGASDQAIRDRFVARYGEWILLAPRAPLAWVVPIVAVVIGAGALLAWIGRGRPAPTLPTAAAVSSADRRRIHEEAEALDA